MSGRFLLPRSLSPVSPDLSRHPGVRAARDRGKQAWADSTGRESWLSVSPSSLSSQLSDLSPKHISSNRLQPSDALTPSQYTVPRHPPRLALAREEKYIRAATDSGASSAKDSPVEQTTKKAPDATRRQLSTADILKKYTALDDEPSVTGFLQVRLRHDPSKRTLTLMACEAVALPPRKTDHIQKREYPNAYMAFYIMQKARRKLLMKTKPVQSSFKYEWNKSCSISNITVATVKKLSLLMVVWDHQPQAKDQFLGEALIDLEGADLTNSAVSYQLYPHDDNVGGLPPPPLLSSQESTTSCVSTTSWMGASKSPSNLFPGWEPQNTHLDLRAMRRSIAGKNAEVQDDKGGSKQRRLGVVMPPFLQCYGGGASPNPSLPGHTLRPSIDVSDWSKVQPSTAADINEVGYIQLGIRVLSSRKLEVQLLQCRLTQLDTTERSKIRVQISLSGKTDSPSELFSTTLKNDPDVVCNKKHCFPLTTAHGTHLKVCVMEQRKSLLADNKCKTIGMLEMPLIDIDLTSHTTNCYKLQRGYDCDISQRVSCCYYDTS